MTTIAWKRRSLLIYSDILYMRCHNIFWSKLYFQHCFIGFNQWKRGEIYIYIYFKIGKEKKVAFIGYKKKKTQDHPYRIVNEIYQKVDKIISELSNTA
jgi:hypothetical protein